MMNCTVCVLAVSSAVAWSQPIAPSLPVAFEHVTVIDATGAPPAHDMTVITIDRRIAAIGPSAAAGVPANARRIDGKGRFLIPGLWDMHVHLTNTTEIAGPALVANGHRRARHGWESHAHRLDARPHRERGADRAGNLPLRPFRGRSETGCGGSIGSCERG